MMNRSRPSSSSRNGAPRQVAVLGSTGSIGTQTLEVLRLFPDRFQVRALTAGSNAELLVKQAREFRPDCVALGNKQKWPAVHDALADTDIRVLAGDEGLCAAATGAPLDDASLDVVVAAVVGFAGLNPVLEALKAGTTVALANKETMVVAGALVNRLVEERGGTLIPIDSEHSAIFQCLIGEEEHTVEELILTASGGPFRTRSADTFDAITPEEALDHPNWSMGAKITIDSATLMNKGLEVIEARWLFDVAPASIRVLVHPQSIVHSMVAFTDGSIKAELGVPDMKVPIQYALSYPDRWPAPHERIDWSELARLDFALPDTEKFPCLKLAFEALKMGGTAPAVLNAANEQAVAFFLEERIRFTDIPRAIERALGRLADGEDASLEAIRQADVAARTFVQELTQPAANSM